jgi:hypothetical protein
MIIMEFLNMTRFHTKSTGSPEIYRYSDLQKRKTNVPESKIPSNSFNQIYNLGYHTHALMYYSTNNHVSLYLSK